MNVKKYVRALLWLYLTLIIAMDAVKAQPLKVGDRLPQELWSMPLQVINHPQGKETITLEEYKDQLIILDFWATWCAPCIKSLTKLDTLQKEFNEQLAVIPITYEAGEKVLPFLTKRGYQLPSIINDSTLKRYFPHRSIPHQVWVRAGEVQAVTGAEYATRENIRLGIRGNSLGFKEKSEVNFDKAKPLFLNGNGGDGSNMLYQSVISGRLNVGIGGITSSNPNSIMAYNQTIDQLYKRALGEKISLLISHRYTNYEVDTVLLDRIKPPLHKLKSREDREEWLSKNLYTYNLVLPAAQNQVDVYNRMLADLNSFFSSHLNFYVKVEKRLVKSLALIKIDDVSDLKDNISENYKEWDRINNTLIFRNEPLSTLVHYMNVALDLQEKKGIFYPYPIVDETGIEGNVTIDVSADLTDFENLKIGLRRYGLDLCEKESEVEFIVFKDFSTIKHIP